MLSLFLSSPPPTPPPGGVRDFSRTPPGGGCVFPGRGTGEGGAPRGRARLFRPHPSLRATFPTGGKAFSGGTLLHVVPLSNGDPACWRPAWGGVRLCGNGWWVRLIFGGWCRFAQDDTERSRSVGRKTKCRIS